MLYTKSPTTYGEFRRRHHGLLRQGATRARATPRFVNHGTTLVINALDRSGSGAKAALVTTSGFRDVLEIARGNRPDPFDLHYRRDEPLDPARAAIRGARAHRHATASVIEPLDVAALTALADGSCA